MDEGEGDNNGRRHVVDWTTSPPHEQRFFLRKKWGRTGRRGGHVAPEGADVLGGYEEKDFRETL